MVELYGKKIGFEQTLSSVIVDRDVMPAETIHVTVPATDEQPRHVQVHKTATEKQPTDESATVKQPTDKSATVKQPNTEPATEKQPEDTSMEITLSEMLGLSAETIRTSQTVKDDEFPPLPSNNQQKTTVNNSCIQIDLDAMFNDIPLPKFPINTVEEISDTSCNASRDTISHFHELSEALQKIKQPKDGEVKKITPEVDATLIISEIFGDGDSSGDEVQADMETEESEQLPDGDAGSPAGSPPPVRPAIHKVKDGGFTKVKTKAQKKREKKNLLKHQE